MKRVETTWTCNKCGKEDSDPVFWVTAHQLKSSRSGRFIVGTVKGKEHICEDCWDIAEKVWETCKN